MAFRIGCKDLGHADCDWYAVSNTEDRLVDYVAVHARDHHGITEFTPEMMASVKNSLGNLPKAVTDSPEPVMQMYNCPLCSWSYFAQTEDLIADAAALHARDAHNITEFTKEMAHTVKSSLTVWTGAAKKSACGCQCAS